MLSVILLTWVLTPDVSLSGPDKAVTIQLHDHAYTQVPLGWKNQTDRVLTFWSSGFWPNNRMTLRDERGLDVPKTKYCRDSEAAFFGMAYRMKNSPEPVKPWHTHSYETDPLESCFDLKPGTYKLVVEYWEKCEKDKIQARSNSITITVQR